MCSQKWFIGDFGMKTKVTKIELSELPHLCDSCLNNFPTCAAQKIIFGINIDLRATGAAKDKIVKCDKYQDRIYWR